MGIEPLAAVEILLQRTDLCTHEFDVIRGSKALGVDASKVTPTGGAIASGHLVGATGVIITIKPLFELARFRRSKAPITMPIGGDQGIALAIRPL